MNMFHRPYINILLILFMLCFATVSFAATNVAPTATIVSATMRTNTTFMDITYCITDPDDATVKVRALAFVNGVVSFANVIRPTTFVEGTASNLGDNIPVGVNHTLTWDVASDWNIDLGQIALEILCRDSTGLIPLEWITIPATAGTEELTISRNSPTDAQLLDALFWLYADGDDTLMLENGTLKGTALSGFGDLVKGTSLSGDAVFFVFKRMDISWATDKERNFATAARAGVATPGSTHAVNHPWKVITDPTAVETNIVNERWVMNHYADGAITMTDCFTGHMWVYDAGSNGTGYWSNAYDHCESMVYAGHDDWMLPNIELLGSAFLFKGAFTNVQPASYWSSTKYNLSTIIDNVRVYYYIAYAINMANGQSSFYNSLEANPVFWIWPYRDTQ